MGCEGKTHACGRCEKSNHRNSKKSPRQEHPWNDREQRILYTHKTTKITYVIYRILCNEHSWFLQTQMTERYCAHLSKELCAFQKCVRAKATAHLRGSRDSLSLAQQSKTKKRKDIDGEDRRERQVRKTQSDCVSSQQTSH